MMKCYVVDAFTKEVFKGNPAAVCVLDSWISDELMQRIAHAAHRHGKQPV